MHFLHKTCSICSTAQNCSSRHCGEDQLLINETNIIILSQLWYYLQSCGPSYIVLQVHLNYYDMPSLHALTCNTSGYDLEFMEVNGNFAFLFARANSSSRWESFQSCQYTHCNRSQWRFFLMFSFSTISRRFFSSSCLHKMCIYLCPKMDNCD